MGLKFLPLVSSLVLISSPDFVSSAQLKVNIDNQVSSEISLLLQATPQVVDGFFSLSPGEAGFEVTSNHVGLGRAAVTYNFLDSKGYSVGHCTIVVQARDDHSPWASAVFSGTESSGPYECALLEASAADGFEYNTAALAATGTLGVSAFLSAVLRLHVVHEIEKSISTKQKADFIEFVSKTESLKDSVSYENRLSIIRINHLNPTLEDGLNKKFSLELESLFNKNSESLVGDLKPKSNARLFISLNTLYEKYFSESHQDFSSKMVFFTKMAEAYCALHGINNFDGLTFSKSLSANKLSKNQESFIAEKTIGGGDRTTFTDYYLSVKNSISARRVVSQYFLSSWNSETFSSYVNETFDHSDIFIKQKVNAILAEILSNESSAKEHYDRLQSQQNSGLSGRNPENTSLVKNELTDIYRQILVENNLEVPRHPSYDFANRLRLTNVLAVLFPVLATSASFLGTLPAVQVNELTLRVRKKEDLGALPVLEHSSFPSGSGVLSEDVAALQVPGEGYRILAPLEYPNTAETNPLLYPMAHVLPGSPTQTPDGCLIAGGMSSLVMVPTTMGLWLGQVDSSGYPVEGQNKTLFSGLQVESVSPLQDETSGSCAAVVVLQEPVSTETESGATESVDRLETRVYVSRLGASGLSVNSTDSDFTRMEHVALDGYGHNYFLTSEGGRLQMISQSSTGSLAVNDALGLKDAGALLDLLILQNGHVLAVMEKGVFYSTKEGGFVPASSSVSDLFARGYNAVKSLGVSENPQEETSKLIFYPKDAESQNLQGAYIVSLPAGDAGAQGMVVETKVFPEKYVGYYDEPSLLAVTADSLTEERTYSGILEHWFDDSEARFVTLTGGDRSPDPASSYVFFASQDGQFFRVNEMDGSKGVIGGDTAIQQISRLWLADTLVLVEKDGTLRFTDKHGADLGSSVSVIPENGENFASMHVALGSAGLEHLFVSTDNGLHLLVPQLDETHSTTGYSHAGNLLEGFSVKSAETDDEGYLVATLGGDFDNVRMISDVPVAELNQDHAYAFSQLD